MSPAGKEGYPLSPPMKPNDPQSPPTGPDEDAAPALEDEVAVDLVQRGLEIAEEERSDAALESAWNQADGDEEREGLLEDIIREARATLAEAPRRTTRP